MSVGYVTTKSEIDTRAGDIARRFQQTFGDVATLKSFLDETPDADLVALGYTAQEATVLKSAFADLWTLTGIWSGQSAPSAAYDYRTFVRQLWGVGSF
jgi:hypothetical protein